MPIPREARHFTKPLRACWVPQYTFDLVAIDCVRWPAIESFVVSRRPGDDTRKGPDPNGRMCVRWSRKNRRSHRWFAQDGGLRTDALVVRVEYRPRWVLCCVRTFASNRRTDVTEITRRPTRT